MPARDGSHARGPKGRGSAEAGHGPQNRLQRKSPARCAGLFVGGQPLPRSGEILVVAGAYRMGTALLPQSEMRGDAES